MNPKLNVTLAGLEPRQTDAPAHDFPQTVFADVDYITAHTVVAQFFGHNPERKPANTHDPSPTSLRKIPNRWLGRIFASD